MGSLILMESEAFSKTKPVAIVVCMSELIPTPIVDKNGRQTTVHRRSDSKKNSRALISSKPVLTSSFDMEPDLSYTIKGKTLHRDSLSLKLLSENPEEQYRLTQSTGEYAWRKNVDVPNSVLYEYLRMGADIQDAATLYGLGVMPEELPDHPVLATQLPGRLGRLDGANAFYIIQNRGVLLRFEDAGFPAVDVEKAIANKIQDWVLDRGLNDQLLLDFFSKKKKYHAVVGSIGQPANDRVINAFVLGRLPLTVADMPTASLKDVSKEVIMMNDSLLSELVAQPEVFGQIIRKSLDSDSTRNVQSIYELFTKHGPEILDMDDPFLCAVQEHVGAGNDLESGSLEFGKYLDQVHQLIIKNDNQAFGSSKYEWWGRMITNDIKVINSDLNDLRKSGVTPQEAYEGLVVHRLSTDQVIVSHADSLHSGFSGGAL